jgi:hypothetical protein
MATDPREAKLPKWTQELLASLRRELDDVRADFEEYADKEMPADAVAVANPYDEHPRLAARKGEVVEFRLGRGRTVTADVDPYDGALLLHGSAGVLIDPTTSNDVRLIVRGRDE